MFINMFAEPAVAFSVAATGRLVINDGDKFTYDRVIVNAGGGYDAAQNWFTCPHTGFYLFTINTLANARSEGVNNGITIDGTPLSG